MSARSAGIGRLALERPGLALVGACARRPERAGREMGPALGLDRSLGVAIRADLPGLLEEVRPDVVVQATCSRLEEAEEEGILELEEDEKSGGYIVRDCHGQ